MTALIEHQKILGILGAPMIFLPPIGLPVQCTDYRILDESDRRGKSYSDYTSDNYPR